LKEYIKANRELWDELTNIHLQATDYYNIESFRSGVSTLRSIELEEVGDVVGKSLLHLQCHFGLDTLSWARLGAVVVGVDLSPESIRVANSLKRDMGIAAKFLCSDVYDLPQVLTDQFDIVFSSYGVLLWIPDLGRWAKIIASFLNRGGSFFMVDGHPFSMILRNDDKDPTLKVCRPYFHSRLPREGKNECDYANPNVTINRPSYTWHHSLSDVINSLTSAGLEIESFLEYPYCDKPYHSFMDAREDGWWSFKAQPDLIPLTFSVKAVKRY